MTHIVQNEYECWIVGQRQDTEETVVAASSFEARKVVALKYQAMVSDVVAHRIDNVVRP